MGIYFINLSFISINMDLTKQANNCSIWHKQHTSINGL